MNVHLVFLAATALVAVAEPAPAQQARGMDSDFHCCSVNFQTAAANGIQFACIKATALDQGFSNSVFAARMSAAHAAGVYTIPYNRCNPSTYQPMTEAQFFWSWARTNIGVGGYNLSPALDVEDGLTGSYIGDNGGRISLAGWCNEWFNDVSNYAAAAGIQLQQLTYINVGITCALGTGLNGYLWLADPCCSNNPASDPYTCGGCSASRAWDGCLPTGAKAWTVYQYAWYQLIPGPNEHVDLDVANGTLAQLVATLGTTAFVPPGFQAGLPAPTNLTFYAGQSFTFTVQATGTLPFYYRWYYGTNTSTPLPNGTNASYTATAVVGQTSYLCQASNSFNGLSVTNLTVTLTGIAPPTHPYPLSVLSNNPDAYWRLDETNGEIAYDHVGGHNSRYYQVQQGGAGFNPAEEPDLAALFGTNTLTQTSCASNSYALELDQSSNGLPNLDFATASSAQFSVEAWANFSPQSPSGGIVTKGYGHGEEFALDLGAPNTDFRFFVRDNSGATAYVCNSTNHPDGNWHHLVGVCDEVQNSAWLYVDGALAAKTGIPTGAGLHEPVEGMAGLGDNRVSIGARLSNQTATTFDLQTRGTVDEVALYGHPLSSNQVSAHYLAGLAGSLGVLTISNLPNGQVALVWNFSGTLQSAPTVTGPYASVAQASPYTVAATNKQMFFRVQR